MGILSYVANVSLDGFVEDEHGSLDWTETRDDVFSFITDLVRPARTYLYGRRMYEAMALWETDPTLAGRTPLTEEFARIWSAADKVVVSTTLGDVPTARTRVERALDPDAVRALKDAGDMTVGGSLLAGHAFAAGLVDEHHLLVRPIVLGAGKPALPAGTRADLELVDERRFDAGVVYLRYRVRTSG